MPHNDLGQIADCYNALFRQHGDSPQAVAWGTVATQNYRFKVLTEVGDLETASILDVGCGKADLYYYLHAQGFRGTYVGLDISSDLIDFARKKFPHISFIEGTLQDRRFDEPFDYVLMSGIFNIDAPGMLELVRTTLQCAYANCRKAIAFNLISTYVERRDEGFFYASPEEMFTFCKQTLSRYVTLRHDYMPFGFTMYVYRKDDWTPL